jgi:hypothetical protein
VDFDPIGVVTVFILQAVGIVGQKFTDPDQGDRPLGAEQGEHGKQEQREAHGVPGVDRGDHPCRQRKHP